MRTKLPKNCLVPDLTYYRNCLTMILSNEDDWLFENLALPERLAKASESRGLRKGRPEGVHKDEDGRAGRSERSEQLCSCERSELNEGTNKRTKVRNERWTH
jgi:hypothetical protein